MYETKQEIFDAVWAGLASQNWEPSVDSTGACKYRGEHGRKCAAGWLIPDWKYFDRFEHVGVHASSVEGDMLRSAMFGPPQSLELNDFVWELQKAHDYAADGSMTKYQDMQLNFERVAANHGLTVPAS